MQSKKKHALAERTELQGDKAKQFRAKRSHGEGWAVRRAFSLLSSCPSSFFAVVAFRFLNLRAKIPAGSSNANGIIPHKLVMAVVMTESVSKIVLKLQSAHIYTAGIQARN
jgi:hypothetical protein